MKTTLFQFQIDDNTTYIPSNKIEQQQWEEKAIKGERKEDTREEEEHLGAKVRKKRHLD